MRVTDVKAMLQAAGAHEALTPLAIQYAFFYPRTCDPDAQGVIMWVEAIQNVLAAKGAPLEVDGSLGPDTALYLQGTIGPKWPNLTWVAILGRLLAAKRVCAVAPAAMSPMAAREAPAGVLDTVMDNPILIVGGVAFWYFFLRPHPKRDERRARARGAAGRGLQSAGRWLAGKEA